MSSPPRVAHMSLRKMTTQGWQEFVRIGDWKMACTQLANGVMVKSKTGCIYTLLLQLANIIGTWTHLIFFAMITSQIQHLLAISGKSMFAKNLKNWLQWSNIYYLIKRLSLYSYSNIAINNRYHGRNQALRLIFIFICISICFYRPIINSYFPYLSLFIRIYAYLGT